MSIRGVEFTGIGVTYVRKWGFPEGGRELISNGVDAELRYAHLGIGRLTVALEGTTLVVRNDGVTVEFADFWLLGESESRDEANAIGMHGEGGPLGCLGCVREGHDIVITNGQERWRPMIVTNPKHGRDVLAVQVTKLRKPRDYFEVRVEGVTAAQFGLLRQRFLRLDPRFDMAQTVGRGGEPVASLAERCVLTRPHLAGSVYVKGVLVCQDRDLLWGYNLRCEEHNQLSRNRDSMDEETLASETGKALSAAFTESSSFGSLMVEKLLDAETVEVSQRWNNLTWNTPFCEALIAEWEKRHGEEALPLEGHADDEDIEAAKVYGLTAVKTSVLVKRIIGEAKGTVDDAVGKAKRSILKRYPLSALTENEVFCLRAAQILLTPYLKVKSIVPVRFAGERIRVALGGSGEAFIARGILSSLDETLQVVATLDPADMAPMDVLAKALAGLLSGRSSSELNLLILAKARH